MSAGVEGRVTRARGRTVMPEPKTYIRTVNGTVFASDLDPRTLSSRMEHGMIEANDGVWIGVGAIDEMRQSDAPTVPDDPRDEQAASNG